MATSAAYIDHDEAAAPATPAAGKVRIYAKTDGLLYSKDDAGTETLVSAGAGLSNPMTTAEDIIVGGASGAPARLAVGTEGQVLSVSSGAVAWADAAAGGGGELSYVEFTSNVSPTSNGGTPVTTANSDLVVAAAAVAFDGSTKACIEFYSNAVRGDPSISGASVSLFLFDGTTSLGRISISHTPAAVNATQPVLVRHYLTPSNASHTYSVRAVASAASTGFIGAGSGGTGPSDQLPGYIRVSS